METGGDTMMKPYSSSQLQYSSIEDNETMQLFMD